LPALADLADVAAAVSVLVARGSPAEVIDAGLPVLAVGVGHALGREAVVEQAHHAVRAVVVDVALDAGVPLQIADLPQGAVLVRRAGAGVTEDQTRGDDVVAVGMIAHALGAPLAAGPLGAAIALAPVADSKAGAGVVAGAPACLVGFVGHPAGPAVAAGA